VSTEKTFSAGFLGKGLGGSSTVQGHSTVIAWMPERPVTASKHPVPHIALVCV